MRTKNLPPLHARLTKAAPWITVLVPWLLTAAAPAADWPQFRGPHRDNVWTETGLRPTFPAEGLKIRWRKPVSNGWSSPVVAQGQVFVTDALLRKPSVQERVHCFEEATGQLLWTHA